MQICLEFWLLWQFQVVSDFNIIGKLKIFLAMSLQIIIMIILQKNLMSQKTFNLPVFKKLIKVSPLKS